MPFNDTWDFIQINLQNQQLIDNWTNDKGYIGDKFNIIDIGQNSISVNPPGSQTIQVISIRDIEGVYSIWQQYRNAAYPRHRIRDEITRFSKYIISIFYWVELNNNGSLP